MLPAAAPANANRRSYWIVAGVLLALHLALYLHDIASPEGFFRADRARFRLHAITRLLDSSGDYRSFIECLSQQGNIGDYGLHAAFYALGGPLAVVAMQTVLALLAALAVTYIARRALGSERLALASGLLYGLLPQSLAFPHQLLSESLSNPLLIFGTAGVLHVLEQPSRLRSWIWAGLGFGFAALVRPALVLLPLVAAGALLVLQGRRASVLSLSALVTAGLAPCILWSAFMLAHVGKFGLGDSNQDLGVNLSLSTAKVLLSEGRAPADGSWPRSLPKRLTLTEYAGYLRTYPGGFANLYFKNVVVMMSDSGIGRLYVDLLGFGVDKRLELQDPAVGWRAQLTNKGPVAALRQLWTSAPGTLLAGAVGATVFAFVNFGLLVSYIVLLRGDSAMRSAATSVARRWCLAFLVIVPLYVLATSQVVPYAASRLRSQGEFAWAILACLGWASIALRVRRAPQTIQV